MSRKRILTVFWFITAGIFIIGNALGREIDWKELSPALISISWALGKINFNRNITKNEFFKEKKFSEPAFLFSLLSAAFVLLNTGLFVVWGVKFHLIEKEALFDLCTGSSVFMAAFQGVDKSRISTKYLQKN